MLILSASMGAGHHTAAAELARRTAALGHDARVVDVLSLPAGSQGERLRRTYGLVLRRAPFLYEGAMRVWARWPRLMETLTGIGNGPYLAGLRRELAGYRPHAVVSTYNLASHVLGRLCRAGELAVPVLTYVTDPGAHPYWVDRHVGFHLCVTPETAAAYRALGANGVVASGPLIRSQFAALPDRETARRAHGLTTSDTVALVTAGSWGVGAVPETVRALAGAPGVLPVALCARDVGLLRRLRAAGLGHPVGWTDDMPGLFAAADVLVDNAGGMTCLEALAAGVPVVIYHPLPGHGRLNAQTLHASGRALWARSPEELAAAVALLSRPGPERDAQIARGQEIVRADPCAEVLRIIRDKSTVVPLLPTRPRVPAGTSRVADEAAH